MFPIPLLTVSATMTVLRSQLVGFVPFPEDVIVSRPVLMFAIVIGLATTVSCALVPALGLSTRTLLPALRTGAPGTTGQGASPDRLAQTIVAVQVTVTMVLLIAGVYVAAHLSRLVGTDLGFRPSGLLTFRMVPTGVDNRDAVIDQTVDALASVPGIERVAVGTSFPLSGRRAFGFRIGVMGEPAPDPDRPLTAVDLVSPGYFRAMGVAVVSGREFSHLDGPASRPVALVNETFAATRLEGRDAIGALVTLGGLPDEADIEVVGVVADVRDDAPGMDPGPVVYRPFTQARPQMSWHTAMVAVRTRDDPRRLESAAREAVAAAVPGATVYDVATMDERVASTVTSERQLAFLYMGFGLAALLLAAIGAGGLVRHVVERDMRAFGIRLALGCRPVRLVGAAAWRGFAPALLGVALGGLIMFAVSNPLLPVTEAEVPADLVSILASGGMILIVGLCAAVLPACRVLKAPLARLLVSD